MDIDFNKLNFSSYKLPFNTNETVLKNILKCSYCEALELTEKELERRIYNLKDVVNTNKKLEDYSKEWYMLNNMIANYEYVLPIIKIRNMPKKEFMNLIKVEYSKNGALSDNVYDTILYKYPDITDLLSDDNCFLDRLEKINLENSEEDQQCK